MWRSVASNGLAVLIVLFLALAVAVNWGRGQWTADGPAETAFCLRVPSGSTFQRVTRFAISAMLALSGTR